MQTLNLLAHVSDGLHTHAKGVEVIIIGMAILALCFYLKKRA